ncbi:MAG: hypothetical protein JWP94_349 [Mucilaginibacter sp.]|nr:hypothetical protein [Mucilaginibacter sp.]
MKIEHLALTGLLLVGLAACDHSKPKPISNNITKTVVTVNGKKDSVINNPEKNYGNATVSEPCVKCLLQIIQKTDSYKKVTALVPQQKIIYDVNWITSTKPKEIGAGNKIINGMEIDVNEKTSSKPKSITTFLYNNATARFYLRNSQGEFDNDAQVDTASLKKIRNSCFWGVASAK